MAYQILNNLGEVVIESVSEEELTELKEFETHGHHYYQYDDTIENNILDRWKADTEKDYTTYRLYKKIV